MMISSEKYVGCFLGLALGDAYGAAYEGGVLERALWRLIGTTQGRKRYTDDTQMSINVATSFLECSRINTDHLAKTFAQSYRWSRGYGASAAKLLKKIRSGSNWQSVNRLQFKEGSFGNGAAMRAPIVALCYPFDLPLLQHEVIKTAEITHAHPLAIEGAQLIAYVVASALNGDSVPTIAQSLPDKCRSKVFSEKVLRCQLLIKSDERITTKNIRRELGNGMAAIDSCVTAIYFALKYSAVSVDDMFSEVFKLGGDADTIASMAGAIWGAINGSSSLLPKVGTIEDGEYILDLALKIHENVESNLKL